MSSVGIESRTLVNALLLLQIHIDIYLYINCTHTQQHTAGVVAATKFVIKMSTHINLRIKKSSMIVLQELYLSK